MKVQMQCMNLSCKDVEAMQRFYAGVFGVEFSRQTYEEHVLYDGTLCGLGLVLLPQEMAGVDADDNRMQLDFEVDDLDEAISRVEASGGRTNGRIGEDETMRCIGAFDPDGSFMVLKQPKNSAH